MIGQTLAHYEIVEQIGSGGMGDVYRARDTKLARDVALKVLPAEFSKDDSRRNRFVREAQAVAALKHPNIVTIYSVEEANTPTGPVHFMTMELVEGDTMVKRITSGGVSLDAFFEYAVPLSDAISSAHDQGITHRDLKPSNIMFDRDGRLKVLDFGLAKLLATATDTAEAETVVDIGDTAAGQILGTTAYMSPEQAEGKEIDHRSDIFSLGIVLYELATGERPFKGDSQLSTLSSILKDAPQHISEVRREMPRHVGRIVNHCLEKSPDRRFQSAKDVRNDLEGLKAEVASGELTAELESGGGRVVTPVAGGKNTRIPLPLITVGVIVVVAVLAWRFWPHDSSTTFGSAGRTGAALEVQADVPKVEMAVVLPFDNLGSDDDAYFAAGMTDELTSRLSAVQGLGVISRTSAKQYERTGKTVKDIGEDLGVQYVVEGSVRFAKIADGAARVRITSLLVRVSDDKQLWAQTYDRTIEDVFDVQTEIATEVVGALGVTLGAGEEALVATIPTTNMEAYEAYVRAKNYDSADGDFHAGDKEVVRLLTLATELDPNFLEAWATLSGHHSGIYSTPFARTDARIIAARTALEKAEAIDPDHPRTHIARGSYYYYCFLDYDRALESYLAAKSLVPNSSDALARVAYIYRRQGRWTEHIEALTRAFELDPRNDTIAYNLGGSFRALREFAKSNEMLDTSMKLNPNASWAVMDKANLLASWRGDYEEITTYLDGMKPSMFKTFAIAISGIRYGEFKKARAAADALPEFSEEFTIWRLFMLSLVDHLEHGNEAAREGLVVVEELAREFIKPNPINISMRGILADALALQGRYEEAIQEARYVADVKSKDKYSGPKELERIAWIFAMNGRHDEAIELLETLLETTYESAITEIDLEQDIRWDPLREHPRFKALVPPPG